MESSYGIARLKCAKAGIGRNPARHCSENVTACGTVTVLQAACVKGTSRSGQRTFDALTCVDQTGDGLDGVLEHGFFFLVQRDFDNALDAAGADHRRNADVGVIQPIRAPEQTSQNRPFRPTFCNERCSAN